MIYLNNGTILVEWNPLERFRKMKEKHMKLSHMCAEMR
jgi:hypothetical protein